MISSFLHKIKLWFDLKSKRTGLTPQPQDDRDYIYKPSRSGVGQSFVDLRHEMPPVNNQGNHQSCTAFAIGAVVQHWLKKNGIKQEKLDFSEAYQWYWHRYMEGKHNENSGVFLRDGFKVMNKWGVCRQRLFPNTKPFNEKPSETEISWGLLFWNIMSALGGNMEYKRVYKSQVINCLDEGLPVVFGIRLDRNFVQLDKTDYYWEDNSDGFYGYHAMVIVGYEERLDGLYYLVRNSWGTRHGNNGYLYMKKEMFDKSFPNGGFDLWTVE